MADQFILSFGNSAMSFGGASVGWEPPEPSYTPILPYLIFEFSASGFVPTSGSFSGCTSSYGRWTQISSSPNRWYWEGWHFNPFSEYYGWPVAFCDGDYHGRLITRYLGGGTCKVVGYGNLDYTGSAGYTIMDMDRTFSGCDGLTEFVTIQTPNTMSNVGGCFQNCTELIGGALDQYTYWSTYNTGITNHSGTFTDAGANTVTGLGELDQIPTGWGGNLAPVSHTYTAVKANAAAWLMHIYDGDDGIPFDNLGGALNIFTTASISAYAGVNMRKTNIWNRANGFSTSKATYYYPMFWQGGYPARTSPGVYPDWIRTTSMYNGMLTSSQSAGDMPGTLDYSAYGPMDKEFGTFDPNEDIYFGFLVVNNPDLISDGTFNCRVDAFGIHSNTNFRNSVINWFIE